MPAGFILTLTENDGSVRERRLAPGSYVIGREPDCDIVLSSEDVSHHHAKLTLHQTELLIEDLGSSAGTRVQNIPVSVKPQRWPYPQSLSVGSVSLEVRPQEAAAAPLAALGADPAAGVPFVFGNEIARGGMGSIIEADDKKLGRKIAVKVMLLETDADDAQKQRFVQEAAVLGRLEHPNIVPVHDLGFDAHGQLYYTMKLVKGRTLQAIIKGLRQDQADTTKTYTLAHLLTIFRKVCDAMAFAHSRGIIHRDLKPENIMVGEFGEVLVMDWGLAKILDAPEQKPLAADDPGATIDLPGRRGPSVSETDTSTSSMMKTLEGSVMGTPQYMSPEQAEGRIAEMDARSDIFSLGGILYAILTLRPPIEGRTLDEVLQKVISGSIAPLSVAGPTRRPSANGKPAGGTPATQKPIPPALAAVTMKALSLDKAKRYQNVTAFSADIEAYQNGFATSAENAGSWKQFTLLIKRHKAASIGVAAVLLVGGVLGTKAILEGKRAERALADLRGTAPEFAGRAAELFANEKLEEAGHKLEYAIALDPQNVDFRLTRANFYEAQLRLTDAVRAFREVLAIDPNHAKAQEHVALCEQLENTRGADGKLPRTALTHLLDAMTKENRSPAEKFSVSKLLGRENDALRDVWLAKLHGLPPGNNPLTRRLVVDPEGRMRLDLRATPINDLSPLSGMPLNELNVNGTSVADLGPLKGMRLDSLNAEGCHITDLTPLAGMPLRHLHLNLNRITSVSPLAGMQLTYLALAENPVKDLSPLHGMPLVDLDINGSTTTDLNALRGMPQMTRLNLTLVPAIADLTPLVGMRLKSLVLYGNDRIIDLTPLHDCPFESLIISRCQRITDISAISQPMIRRLSLAGSNGIVNVRPLSACTELEELVLPPHAKDIEFLRALPKLRNLGYTADLEAQWTTMTTAQFWKEYDAQQAAKKPSAHQ